jgi:2-iminobutanoate/2-iminopropanoate deaminase
MKTILSFIFILVSVNCFSQSKKQIILTENAPKPIGPYSQAIKVGNTVYVSGQIALRNDGTMDSTSIENETLQVITNIKAVLAAAKMDLNNVVKSTIYVTDLKNFKKMNEVYATFFKENPPARETVEVKAYQKMRTLKYQ